MELLASGREADIFAYGPGLVLRRQREGRSMADEARTMAHARDLGFPVPGVESVSADGLEMVLERVDGPTMVEAIERRPWLVGRMGSMLADLHRRLHELPAPPWVPAADLGPAGDRLLHLDLHPLNVLLGPAGPVVIDWPRAAAGDAATDVAATWVVVGGAALPPGFVIATFGRVGRGILLRRFLAGSPPAGHVLAEAVEWKCADPHMGPAEQAAMRRLTGS